MEVKIEEIKNAKVAFTHGGKFHADDVFSGALLRIVNPEIKIMRGFEVPQDFDGIVFDIGGGEYDHHQVDHRIRDNGVPYAAFGLLWEVLGKQLTDESQAGKFDKVFVQDLDMADNTGCYCAMSDIIGSFNPSWDSLETTDEAYEAAVVVAKTLLEHKIESMNGIGRAEVEVKEAIAASKPPVLELKRFAPWKNWVIGTEYQFVIYPSNRGGYNAQGVPISENTQDLKCSFPEEWAGLQDEELEKVSQIMGLKFCHNSRFLIAGKTIEAVREACCVAIQSGVDR